MGPRVWKTELEAGLGLGRLQEGVPLAPLTTFRIGGPADLLFQAETVLDLVTVSSLTRELGIPAFLLGQGANILVGDEGFRGLVVLNRVGGIDFLDSRRVRAGSGVEVFPTLIHRTVEAGLGGLHHFAGIPSSVGGAIWQNLHFLSPAPARDRTVFLEEFVDSAEIFSEEGKREEVGKGYFDFAYDYSILHERADVVLSVTFKLYPEPIAELHRIIEENLEWRRERHPDLRGLPSAGSIFKKVAGVGAGRLIDECGLKGQKRGRAQIFEGHANIIVNRGGATAKEVRALIALAQETVRKETGHDLVQEISFVGEF